ncbi:MAG TPA: glycosyltransferase family 2 protein [Gemmatimonadales bacterium]|nr:glycosyltransferase family 2 protein [Gemmatimonadales bacterium]
MQVVGEGEGEGGPDLHLVVVIPAFQAAATIGDVVARVRAAAPGASIVVVNDGSNDGSYSSLAETVLVHDKNLGKGAALRDGITAAVGAGASIVVTLDADGQHPPEEIPRLIRPITERRSDLVLGARQRNGGMPLPRRFTNWLSASLATRIGGQRVQDAQTGFRAFTRAVAERVQPGGDRYEYEANFLLEALRAGFRVTSVEVPTIYGASARSHFRSWSDSWRMARAFARHLSR